LVKRYERPIFNLMLRMTGSESDALDLAQEAFVRAYEHLGRFKMEKPFFPWLYTIALNGARNFVRRRRAGRETALDDQEPAAEPNRFGDQEDRLCARLDLERVYQALQRLPVDYREAVFLRYHEDLSMEDLAAALQVSLSGAKMRVHRGLAKLRAILLDGRRDED
jgi:RNA polymerase sigma-70 factor (ECF subfamily)